VSEVTPSGFVRTVPTSGWYYTVNLSPGQVVTGQDFDNFQTLDRSVVTNISFTVISPNGTQTTVTDLRGHTQQGDTVVANFTIAAGAGPTVVSLVSYDAPGPSFDPNTAGQRTVDLIASGTFGPGANSLSVKLPNNFYQVDFVLGQAINHFGPAGSHIFYSAQGRLLSADNAGTEAFAAASLSGQVFSDNTGTGTAGNGNGGIGGVIVTLTGTNDLGQTVTVSTMTDSSGAYSFTGLRSGTYTITVSTPSNFAAELASVGTLGSQPGSGTASSGVISNITLGNGSVGANYNFGELPPQTTS
jgi:hypothetical protein